MPKFRPIFSTINTPGFNFEKYLIPILEPLTHNEFAVKDSFSFLLKKLQLQADSFRLLETETSESSFIFDFILYK